MRHAYALKAPAQNFRLPAWVTVHNAEMAGAALVIILLAFAVLRLSGKKPAPAPVSVPKKSGGGGKLLLAAAAAVGGFVLYERHQNAAAPAKAAPAPSPSPLPHPTPTVTRIVAPHITNYHFPLTGSQILIGLAVIAVVGYLMVRVVARNAS